MPEGLIQTFQMPGIWWLIATMSIAGVVRGFTGFGTALIFVPIAGMFLPPAAVVGTITMTGIASTAALLPRAWRQSDRGEVGILVLAALPLVPVGLWLMQIMEANTILFLAALDVVIVGNLFLSGSIETRIIWLAIVLAVPYFITTMIGQSLFDPKRERSYRFLAFALIGLSVVSGLPIWQ